MFKGIISKYIYNTDKYINHFCIILYCEDNQFIKIYNTNVKENILYTK